MIKKILSLLLSVLLVLGAVSMVGCKTDEKHSSEIAKIWSALSTEKYMRDAVPEEYAEAKLNFAGMKGETQSAQLMITAKEYIKGYNLTVADLVDEKGNKIPADNIKVYAEHYVEIYDPYVNSWKGGQYLSDAGFYPDALVPIDKYRAKRQDRIEKGNNQGLWIDIDIPSDIAEGTYTGSFKLILGADNEEYNIPVSTKVFNLNIPEEIHARTLFLIWFENLGKGEGDNYDVNTDKVYYDYLLSKRITPGRFTPSVSANTEDWLNNAIVAAQNPEITCYAVPTNFLGFSRNKLSINAPSSPSETVVKENIQNLYNGFVSFFRATLTKNIEYREQNPDSDVDIMKKMLFYYEDEPTIGYRSQSLRVFNEQLKKAKVAVAKEFSAELEKYPDLKESFMKISDITPTNYVNDNLFVSSKNGEGEEYVPDYDKNDGVTLWCPEQFNWRSGGFRKTVEERKAFGETFWWYTCVMNSPEMSYYVESMPINMRLASWQQYEMGIEGTLYWDVVAWNGIIAKGSSPYEDVQYSSYGGGEGLLLYPGVTYGQKTPISSIRLEQLRLGSQDYELMWMLDEYLNEYNEKNSTSLKAKDVVSKMGKNLYNFATTYAESEKEGNCYHELEDNRLKLLEILELFNGGKDTEAVSKINAILA